MILRGRLRFIEPDTNSLRRARISSWNQRRSAHGDNATRPFSPLRETMKANAGTHDVEAIVAVFDLSGFTAFCRQARPPAAIPVFLDSFLQWLFRKIEQGNVTEDVAADPLWRDTPFFAKFLGDGILLLWDTGNMVDRQIAKLITVLSDVCNAYRSEFCGKVSSQVNNPPQSLRCRVATGSVFAVNNGRDYVGHCINVAIHLHDYKSFSFCIASEGFTAAASLEASLARQLLLLLLPIKGLSASEPTWVFGHEFQSLQAKGQSSLPPQPA